LIPACFAAAGKSDIALNACYATRIANATLVARVNTGPGALINWRRSGSPFRSAVVGRGLTNASDDWVVKAIVSIPLK
jgi:hypothetical protein